MVAEGLRLNTNKLAAVYLLEEVLSNVWWPVRLKETITRDGHAITREQHEQIQALWLNSTFGLLGIISLRQDTEGPWVGLKKETWGTVPLLDISRLVKEQVKSLLELYLDVSAQELPPFPIQFEEAVQKQGWRYEVDQALIKVINGEAKDLTPIYEMLVREPIICLKPLS
jgi:hypothetical protein